MSLDLGKLEKLRELGNGVVQARCPACAGGGRDRAGEHLRVYPDGRFGCAVYPKDREHRKRIFALAGDNTPRQFTVKVASGRPPVEAARSVTESLTGLLRTLRTGVSESVSSPTSQRAGDSFPRQDLRTLRTPLLMSRAYARGDEGVMCDDTHTCKDNEKGVLSVLSPRSGPMPYFTPGGTLVIPFDSPERFHWWKGGQSVAETLAEVRAGLTADGKECDESPRYQTRTAAAGV